MLLLNTDETSAIDVETHFNTSYVVIKRVKDYGFDPAQSFQYILCCY